MAFGSVFIPDLRLGASRFVDASLSTVLWGKAILLNLYVFMLLFLFIGIQIFGLHLQYHI